MSVSKLLARIVAPTIDDEKCPDAAVHEEYLHDHTYGITSDPLTQFSVILSALIHDLDHQGVPNGQLIKEDPSLAALYQGKSVAEQNAVDLAWNVLLLPDFDELRAAIFGSELELRRFRQLLVNSVIATDIFDKELGTLRRNRWNKAFEETEHDESQDSRTATNRKATIVIEHLIQASDVAHTMQHVSGSVLSFIY
jgi:3'5'-cyclic nucleotide phosphodiesterase